MAATFFSLGALSGAIAVALGAFGAHALKARLEAARLETFETGVRYQMYHALALLLTGLVLNAYPNRTPGTLAGGLFLLGTLLFSGSLYLLAASGKRTWGAVTPFGGAAFIAAWLCLALTFL